MSPTAEGSVAEGSLAGAPAPVTLQKFWQRYFRVYDTLQESIPYRRMIARQAELLEVEPGEQVLDAGTGTGNGALVLAENGARIVGVDFCQEALEMCRRKLPAGDFRFADLTARLDFPDASFDKVACCNVIYTLAPADQETAVGELYRVLKSGGLATVVVFGRDFRALAVYADTLRRYRAENGWLDTCAYALRYSINTVRILYYVGRIKRRQESGDYTFFTRSQLRELLEGAGFEVPLIEPIFSDQCLIALARKGAAKGAGA